MALPAIDVACYLLDYTCGCFWRRIWVGDDSKLEGCLIWQFVYGMSQALVISMIFLFTCVNGTPGHGDINAGAVGNHL